MKKLQRFWIVIIPILVWVVFLIVFSALKTNIQVAEWWTTNISRYYYIAMNVITKYVPFSLTEIFFIFLAVSILIVLIKIIKDLKKKKGFDALKRLGIIANMVLSTIAIYSITCEMAYNRQKIDLPYYQQEVDNTEFKNIYNYYAEDLNYCISQLEFKDDGDIVNKMSFLDLSNEINESIQKNIDSDYFFKTTPNAKPMMSSLIYRELGITGVTFGPLVEPNVNYLATNLELPYTIAHEFAHTMGVMREDEANQFAFYICLNSDHPYLRFSAYALQFNQLTIMTSSSYISNEEIEELILIDRNFNKSRSFAAKYWKEHNLLDKIGDWINSLYIKSSGVPSGTGSYSGGTETSTDPVTLKLIPSKYQRLFFDSYYKNQP